MVFTCGWILGLWFRLGEVVVCSMERVSEGGNYEGIWGLVYVS